MCESSSEHVTSLKSLVTMGILTVRGKVLHQKRGSYKYVLPLKKLTELTGQPLGQKKMLQPQKCTFWQEVPKN